MRKKHKERNSKNMILLSFIVVAGILFIGAAFFFSNQSGDEGGTPSIAVDQQLIDYGDVKFNTNKSFSIKVTNTGDGVLRFTEKPYVEILEGC